MSTFGPVLPWLDQSPGVTHGSAISSKIIVAAGGHDDLGSVPLGDESPQGSPPNRHETPGEACPGESRFGQTLTSGYRAGSLQRCLRGTVPEGTPDRVDWPRYRGGLRQVAGGARFVNLLILCNACSKDGVPKQNWHD